MAKNKGIVIIVCLFLFLCAVTGTVCFFIGAAHSRDNSGTAGDFSRERKLLDRIGEYERREEERAAREGERIAAENGRIERTENAIRAIREFDRREAGLLDRFAKEISILEDFYNSVVSEHSSFLDNNAGKKINGMAADLKRLLVSNV